MICKVCDVNNSEDSKFCIECGIGLNNGKEPKRVVSAEEMKNYLWSFDFSKVKNKTRLNRMINAEMQKWRQDPHYIPIISAPTKTGGFIQAPKNVDMEKFEKELKKQQVFDAMIEPYAPFLSTIKPNDISSGGGLNNEGLLQKYTVEERLLKNYYDATRDNKPCGVCGDMRCNIKHIPPIQQQYQEAFENIQYIWKLRRERLRREYWNNQPFPMYEMRKGLDRGKGKQKMALIPKQLQLIESRITRRDVKKGIKPKSRITGTDVRKGIKPKSSSTKIPKEPFESITIRKGLDRKERKPPPKIDPVKDHIIKKEYLPKWFKRKIPKKDKENPYVGRP